MKVKTSITLSEEILRTLEEVAKDYKNRSDLIEEALRSFLFKKIKDLRDKRELEIINKNATELNKEAMDVLSYQVKL